MNDVDVVQHPRHDQVAEHRLLELLVPRVLERQVEAGLIPLHRQVPLADLLVAEADHRDLMSALLDPGQLPGQVLDMDSRPAVHVGRILVGQDRDPHIGSLSPYSP